MIARHSDTVLKLFKLLFLERVVTSVGIKTLSSLMHLRSEEDLKK